MDPGSDVNKEIAETLLKKGPNAAAAKVKVYLEEQDKIPLDIAVTGETGSGKSTFVNAFRGIDNRDEGAAPTGCVETTMKPMPYTHPNYPNVKLWDLPGIGGIDVPTEKYQERVQLKKFDFFIIISDSRFRDNDVKLAKQIQEMGKKFYFVRSKIDQDLRNEKRSKREFNTEQTLAQIRENCLQGLQKLGFKAPRVFLVSSFDLHLYDFHLLEETLAKELPAHKKNALLFAMPNISLEIIQKKKEAFQSKIKYFGFISAGVAGVPVPGLSLAVDAAGIATIVSQYKKGFGLDMRSLQRLAKCRGIPVNDLLAVIKSPLYTRDILNADLIVKLLPNISSAFALMAAEEGFRFIPLIGIPVAMSTSFIFTYKTLNTFLNMIADDAEKVFKKVRV